jgi:flavin reductase (DIM6/NTAB) family NADH-FMN oxidoreductase RutF
MPAPVSVWTTAFEGKREGWTVSSMLVADGDPAEVVGLLDEDADFTELLLASGRCAVNLLSRGQGRIADAFARVTPSPGGPFRQGEWADSSYGPRLSGAAGWLGVRLMDRPAERAGWALLVRGSVEALELADAEPLLHVRGRYQ